MKANKTINANIIKYPSLYKDINYRFSKEKVLNDLFFVIGNGYDWINGQLVTNELEEETPEKLNADFFTTPIWSKEEDELSYFKEVRLENNQVFKPFELKNVKAINLYPINKYSKINNLPDNITEDWLYMAEEALYLGFNYWKDPYKYAYNMDIKRLASKRNYTAIKDYINNQFNYLYKIKTNIINLKSKKYI